MKSKCCLPDCLHIVLMLLLCAMPPAYGMKPRSFILSWVEQTEGRADSAPTVIYVSGRVLVSGLNPAGIHQFNVVSDKNLRVTRQICHFDANTDSEDSFNRTHLIWFPQDIHKKSANYQPLALAPKSHAEKVLAQYLASGSEIETCFEIINSFSCTISPTFDFKPAYKVCFGQVADRWLSPAAVFAVTGTPEQFSAMSLEELSRPVTSRALTVLHLATCMNRPEIVTAIMQIASGSELRVLQPSADNGYTPLHMTARHNHRGCLTPLLANCDDEVRSKALFSALKDGSTPLHIAARYASAEFVDELLNNCPAEKKDEYLLVETTPGWTALHVAASFALKETLLTLMNHDSSGALKELCKYNYSGMFTFIGPFENVLSASPFSLSLGNQHVGTARWFIQQGTKKSWEIGLHPSKYGLFCEKQFRYSDESSQRIAFSAIRDDEEAKDTDTLMEN
ncbi:ankyrin repeat domain-containing protein [Endozoicomonadaceae bacterium StTr2]